MSECPHDPRVPPWDGRSQYHCPACGEMVLGGFPHPDHDRELDEADLAVIEGRACLYPRRDDDATDVRLVW